MKTTVKTEKKHRRKTKNITAALSKSIAFILILSILIPVIGYYLLPDWVYYLTAATRLFFAGSSITTEYQHGDILDTIKDIEINYDSTVEIFNTDNLLIYSTTAAKSGEKFNLKKSKPINEDYALTYETTAGSYSDSWGYLIKEYNSDAINVTFLDFYTHTPTGERIEICMQVSETTIVSKIEILVSFVTFMACLLISIIFILKYVQSFAKPVKKMVDVTEKLSNLDFSEKCPYTKYEEFLKLSSSINTMSDSLDNALTELQKRNEKLEIDIENEKTIDELRKTFISGISHELKTPIAIIQGYAEGAKTFYAAGNTEIADKYCDIIAEEAERMNNMIMKLLEITRYTSGAYNPNCECFNIHNEVEEWFERNNERICEKGVTVKNEIPQDSVIYADRFLVASNINNYLSNAMSHVDGEMKITASLKNVDGKARIFIENTGMPIEDKDIDKIWDSFYRADKSLSRKQGRFGLGLATVAAIQDLHGEGYGVENTASGVKFWFDEKIPSLTDGLTDI